MATPRSEHLRLKCPGDENVALAVAEPGAPSDRSIRDLVLGSRLVEQGAGEPLSASSGHPRWQALRDAGSTLWLDAADFEACAATWSDAFSGFTTNNSLLAAEVEKGIYDELIAGLVQELHDGLSDRMLVLEVGLALNAVSGLRLARAFGGDVSVELHTDCAHDVEASYRQGRRLHELCPDQFVVKVPLTPAGLIAAQRLAREGIRVNVTLGFSPRQNHLIAAFAQPAFVNVFLGRVEGMIDALGAPAGLGPAETAIAATLHSQRTLRALAAEGRTEHQVRQIAASLRRVEQLEQLAGVDVLTMPTEIADGFVEGQQPLNGHDRTAEAPPELERVTIDGDSDDRDRLAEASAQGVDVFWRVGTSVPLAARQLDLRGADDLDEGRLLAILADNGAGDLFCSLTAEERTRIAEHGKLPDAEAWAARVQAGAASWDGLLAEAGLAAFASDQARIDARIASHLHG